MTERSSPFQAGKIANWDRIIAVNGQLIDDYDTALQLLTRCPNRVSLRVSRIKPAHLLQPIVEGRSTSPLPKSFSPLNAPPTPVVPGVETTIELLKGNGDLGFSIVGGIDTVHGSVFVHEVYDGGLVARDGRLKPGDRLLAVNNTDLRNATHATARNVRFPSAVLCYPLVNRRLQCSHCPCTFTHRMVLLCHIRIPESGIHRDGNTSYTYTHINTSHRPPMSATSRAPPPPSPQTQNLPTYPVLVVTAHAYHASAWSVTCESIAQRPVNQCQEHQHTPVAPDSTIRTAQAHSHTVGFEPGVVARPGVTPTAPTTCVLSLLRSS
ncbi:unnamed protein product [Schistocephalus solidus]|uniref:PDZ domain-containing protein n=1 Tax=Schistocephalus solidus TaxID=70667 RepID=A0A3P7CHH1_SCHSO|nr:unnamed protein product [Schistocephalus solidus]